MQIQIQITEIKPLDGRNVRYSATVTGDAAGVYTFAIVNSLAEFAQANSLSPTGEKSVALFLTIRQAAWKASAAHAATEMTLTKVAVGCKLDRKTGTAIARKTLTYEGGPATRESVKAAMDRSKASSERNLALWALALSRTE